MRLFKFVLILALMIFVLSGTALAQFGTPQAVPEKDGWSVGVGYFYYQDKFKSTDGDGKVDIKQNKIYLQASKAFGSNFEVYLRGGGADFKLEVDNDTESFKGNYEPFGTLGVKGFFPINDIFGVGGFVQGTYFFSKFKDTVYGEDLEVKNLWNVSFGAALQAKLPYDIIVYAGPYAYWTEGKFGFSNYDLETTIKNNTNVGGYVGASFGFTKALKLNIEGQFSERASGGAMVSYAF